jgi:hypothetical protein
MAAIRDRGLFWLLQLSATPPLLAHKTREKWGTRQFWIEAKSPLRSSTSKPN